MKTTRFAMVGRLLAGLLAGAAFLPGIARAAEPVITDPVITYMKQPAYPSSLELIGIFQGSVTIMISIDSNGKMIEWMPLAATKPQFIDAVDRCINAWTFKPAVCDGKPIPYAIFLQLQFKGSDVVSSLGNVQLLQAYWNSRFDPKEVPLVSKISQLDRMPEPVNIVKPVYGADVPKGQRSGEVVISFFIDANGTARMPVLMECKGDVRLAYAAYDAIVQWKFSKPTVNGVPTTVRASQKFIFSENEAVAK